MAFSAMAPRGARLTWTYAALVITGGVLALARMPPLASLLDPGARLVLRVVAGLLLLSALLVAAAWVARAWAEVPPELVGGMTPGEAVIRLLIPVYGIYWMFVVHSRLCAALDVALTAARSAKRAPRNLAIVAGVVTLLAGQSFREAWSSGVAELVMGAFWFAYMQRCDEARLAALAVPARA